MSRALTLARDSPEGSDRGRDFSPIGAWVLDGFRWCRSVHFPPVMGVLMRYCAARSLISWAQTRLLLQLP